MKPSICRIAADVGLFYFPGGVHRGDLDLLTVVTALFGPRTKGRALEVLSASSPTFGA